MSTVHTIPYDTIIRYQIIHDHTIHRPTVQLYDEQDGDDGVLGVWKCHCVLSVRSYSYEQLHHTDRRPDSGWRGIV